MKAGFLDNVDNSGQIVTGASCATLSMCSNTLFDNIFFVSVFACTRLYVETMTQEGRPPNATELSTTGVAVPEEISGGPDSGMFGGTRMHSCDGATGQFQGYNFGG